MLYYVIENGEEIFIASEIQRESDGMWIDASDWVNSHKTEMKIISVRSTYHDAFIAAEQYCGIVA